MRIEDTIISYLEQGAMNKAILIEKISTKFDTSIQATYKALRKLKLNGVVVEHKDRLSLSMWYVESQVTRWSKVSATYESKLSYGDFIFLEPGKKFVRHFTTYNDLDRYWVTAFLLVERVLPENLCSYTLMPHDWYIYANVESDVYWTKNHKQKQRLIVTNPFEIDKLVSKIRRKNGYEVTYGVNPFKQDDRRHYSIVGDWIFEVDFDETFTQKLIAIIKTKKNIDEIDKAKIKNIINEKGVFKMSVYHNSKKSVAMVKKIKKYFE